MGGDENREAAEKVDKDLLEQFKKENVGQSPCPSCGRCPTCGRGGYRAYPPYVPVPMPWPGPPYRPWPRYFYEDRPWTGIRYNPVTY